MSALPTVDYHPLPIHPSGRHLAKKHVLRNKRVAGIGLCTGWKRGQASLLPSPCEQSSWLRPWKMTAIKYQRHYDRRPLRALPVSSMFQIDARTMDVRHKMLWTGGEWGGVKMKYLHLGDSHVNEEAPEELTANSFGQWEWRKRSWWSRQCKRNALCCKWKHLQHPASHWPRRERKLLSNKKGSLSPCCHKSQTCEPSADAQCKRFYLDAVWSRRTADTGLKAHLFCKT